jgi:hypothetical protein
MAIAAKARYFIINHGYKYRDIIVYSFLAPVFPHLKGVGLLAVYRGGIQNNIIIYIQKKGRSSSCASLMVNSFIIIIKQNTL